MRRLTSLLITPLFVLSVTSATGCSWFGSGSEEEGELSESDLAAQREGRFGSGNIPTAEGDEIGRAHV